MTKRRGQGEGSIYQRGDGLYVGSVDLGWEAGRRKRKYVYGKTHKAVLAKLQAAQQQVVSSVPFSDERRTVESFLTSWAEDVLPRSGVKASTADGYRDILGRYVIPHVGKVRLSRLAPEHVHAMLVALEAQGLSPRTRQLARAILRRALRHAESWGMVTRNAAALVDSPRQTKPKLDDALTITEAEALLQAAAGHRMEALVTVALAMGLRKGEALALRWEDVDLVNATLKVCRTLKRRTGVGLVIDSPKTERSTRVIQVPAHCVEALQRHRERQTSERLDAGSDWIETGFVFTTATGGLIDPRNLTRLYHRISIDAGLGPRRFHALRHSAATLMLSMGVPLEVISATLGHHGYSITADFYAHVGPMLQLQAAQAMDGLLKSISPQTDSAPV